nr:hypothetical protein DM860_008691 [Ipomoea trifida]
MSGIAKRSAWMVATSIAAVEALKDQGFARWNYPLRSLHQHAQTKVASYNQAMRRSSALQSFCKATTREAKLKRERNFNRVMDVNCWGPSTVRF